MEVVEGESLEQWKRLMGRAWSNERDRGGGLGAIVVVEGEGADGAMRGIDR